MSATKISVLAIDIENFKGVKAQNIKFTDKTVISGKNAVGKTTIFDAFTWCMFGKNSLGKEKFEIRTLDADGKKVHNTDISVKVTIEVDGRTTKFSKTQKENWVKKRGNDTATLQGNVNSYEVDGYPTTEADYKERIADIIGEDRFKLLSNPAYFPSLDWKEQRQIIMEFANEQTDAELAKEIGGFDGLIDELEKAPSLDAIKDKYTKALKEFKAKQKELPVRIDELQKQKVDYDVSALELEKTALTSELDALKATIDTSDSRKTEEKLRGELLDVEFDLNEIKRKIHSAYVETKVAIDNRIMDLRTQVENVRSSIRRLGSVIESDKNNFLVQKKAVDELKPKYDKLKALSFDEKEAVCPVCKRRLPEEEVTKLKDTFENDKARQIKAMADKGNAFALEVKAIEKRISDNNAKLHDAEVELGNIAKSLDEQIAFLGGLKTESELLSDDDNYKACIERKNALNGKLSEVLKGKQDDDAFSDEKASLEDRLEEVNVKLSRAQANISLDERISELQTEQQAVAQKVANQEKMLYVLEQFTRAKMDKISATINSNFDGVEFSLFAEQINGGIKETCECSVGGVPYNSLNSGHKIVAGLKIIQALQSLYDCNSVVWVDNAETINNANIPTMNNQLVLLKVTDSEKVVVE